MNATPLRSEFAHAGLMTAPAKAIVPPDWDRLVKKMANGLREVLASSGYAAIVSPGTSRALPLVEWLGELPPSCAVARFDASVFKGSIFVSVRPAMVGAMVDRFYGGNGTDDRPRAELTPGETRYFDRFASQVGETLTQALAPALIVEPQLGECYFDASDIASGREDEEVLVQAFGIDRYPLEMVFPLSAMRALSGSVPAVVAAVPRADPVWRAELAAAAMEIRFPVRTVIANPTVTVECLLGLAPGDFIPVDLPPFVPLTVAGRLMGRGLIGEANGRAAIEICSMNGGSEHDR